ncbi:MAG: sugar phosphate isomerase/epimerase family protein [Planctomycetota bacterium]
MYRRAGCTVGQYYRNPNDRPALSDVKSICGDAGLAIDSIHGVFGDAYDPSSPDENTRRFAMDTYRDEAAVALELGGPMVVVHPSPLLAQPPEDPGEVAAHVSPLRQSMEDLARMGEELGVVYLIENLPPNCWIGSDSQALAEMARAIESPHLRLCFDVGHAFINGSIGPQLAGCADLIDYLHIHDNNGQDDSHLMPGDGHIDWRAVGAGIARHGLKSPMMLEVFYLNDRLEDELDSGLRQRLVDWLTT